MWFGEKSYGIGIYCSIATHLEDSLAGLSSQWLGASDHAICAVNDTAATWELNEVRVIGRIDSSRTETHLQTCVKKRGEGEKVRWGDGEMGRRGEGGRWNEKVLRARNVGFSTETMVQFEEWRGSLLILSDFNLLLLMTRCLHVFGESGKESLRHLDSSRFGQVATLH